MFKNSILPAIDINKSISRIGSKAQTIFLSQISSSLKEILRNYFTISSLLQIGQVLTNRQKYQYSIGKIAINLWLQSEFKVLSYSYEYIITFLLEKNLLMNYSNTTNIINILFNLLNNKYSDILLFIDKSKCSNSKTLQLYINYLISYIIKNLNK